MKGRPRTPTKVLVARGSWRAGTLGRDKEPDFGGVPSCPNFLCDDASEEWKRIIQELGPAKIATKADRAALAVYCESWAEFVQSCRALAENTTKKIMYQVARKRAAMDSLLKAAQQFGLTPSSRSRVQAVEGKNASSDSKARFFQAS